MEKFKNVLKRFVAVVSVMALSLFGGGSVSAEENEVIEIEWWYAFGGSSQVNNDALAEKFNETVGKEKGIHVTATSQGGYDDIFTKIQSGFVAGEVPHLSVVNSLSVVQFGKNGMLEPIDDIVDQEAMEDFYPGLLLNSYYDGVQYGYPFLRSTPLMYYNASLFKELGIEEKLETYEDVRNAAKVLVENGYGGLGIKADQWQFDGLLRQNDGGWFDEDLTESTIACPENKEVFEMMRQDERDGLITFYASNDDLDTAFANGQLGLRFQSTGSLANLLQTAEDQGFELGNAFIPTINGTRNVPTGGNNIVMLAGHSEEEKEATAIFMNWLVQPEQVVHSHITTGYLPTRRSVATHEDIVKLYEEQPLYKTALDQLEWAGIEPNVPGYAEMVQLEHEMITEIFITDTDLDTLLQETQDKANQIMEENR